MMDLKRWTESDSDSTELERELVTAGQRASLPRELKQEIWSVLAQATLPLSPPVQTGLEGGTSTAAAGSMGLQLSAAKLLLGLAALGAISSGAYWALGRGPRTTVASVAGRGAVGALPSAIPVLPSAAPERNVVEASELPARSGPNGSTMAAASGAASNPGSAQLRETQLREESQAVLEVRRVLRAGEAASALRLLDQARVRFAHPVLGQEREALSIEALARSGARDVAERRATAFLRAYPKSPYAADVRAFTAR